MIFILYDDDSIVGRWICLVGVYICLVDNDVVVVVVVANVCVCVIWYADLGLSRLVRTSMNLQQKMCKDE
jgi:hypothetical protein